MTTTTGQSSRCNTPTTKEQHTARIFDKHARGGTTLSSNLCCTALLVVQAQTSGARLDPSSHLSMSQWPVDPCLQMRSPKQSCPASATLTRPLLADLVPLITTSFAEQFLTNGSTSRGRVCLDGLHLLANAPRRARCRCRQRGRASESHEQDTTDQQRD